MPTITPGLEKRGDPDDPGSVTPLSQNTERYWLAGAIASPPAVINAITHAIGTEDLAMPATPQAVWAALQKSTIRAAA